MASVATHIETPVSPAFNSVMPGNVAAAVNGASRATAAAHAVQATARRDTQQRPDVAARTPEREQGHDDSVSFAGIYG